MKNLHIVEWARRELRAALKLAPWVVASLLLTAVLWQADLSAISGLFQSPPTATPTPRPTTPAPTNTPAPTQTDVPAEAPTATTVLTDTVEPSPSPTEQLETPTATSTSTLTPTLTSTPTWTPTATPSPSPAPVETAAETDESQRHPGDDSDLMFEWGMLFDSVALGVSYLWLCCGVFVLLGIPIFFLVLWIVGKRRQQQE